MKFIIIAIAFFSDFTVSAQQVVTLEEAISQALQNNKLIQAADLSIEYQRKIKRTSTDVGKTNVMYMRGQYNSYSKEDNNITITQSIPFPTSFTSHTALGKSLIREGELQKAVTENELAYQVKQVYYQLAYLYAKEELLQRQDSIYNDLVKAADLRYKTGEARLLEKTAAETQSNETKNFLSQTRGDILINRQQLANLMGSDQDIDIVSSGLEERLLSLSVDSVSVSQNPQIAFLKQQVETADSERSVASAKFLPDIIVGYFNQTLIGTPVNANGELATSSDRFQGFTIGLSIPLWFVPQSAKVSAAKFNEQRLQAQFEYNQKLTQGQWQQAVQEYSKNKNSVTYYQTSALQNAELILKQSDLAFRGGEIDYTERWLTVRNALQIRENYLNNLNNLNQSVITLEFLAGLK